MTLSSFRFFFSSRRRHTRFDCDWSSDVCSSDLAITAPAGLYMVDSNARWSFHAIARALAKPRGWDVVETHDPDRDERMLRSEERRVGKECRSRWSPEP